MLQEIWEFIVNITEPLFMFFVMYNKLKLRKNALPFALLSILLCAGVTTLVNKLGIDYLPCVLIVFVEYLTFAFAFFKGTLGMRALYSALSIFALVAANMTVAPLVMALSSSAEMLSPTLLRVVAQIFYVALNGFLTWLIIRFNEKDRYIPNYIKISVVTLTLIGCASLYLLMNHIILLAEHGMSLWIGVVLSATILLLTVALFFFMDRISRAAEKMNNAEVELTRANAELEYNTQVSAVIDTFREIKHDYASHITALAAFAHDENWDALKTYLSDLNESYGIEKYFSNTGNRTFDSIVTSKALICSNRGIDFDITALLPPELPFSDMETAALFGNLLDNAINAQESVDAHKYVSLEVKTKGRMLCITVKNSSCGNYRYEKGELATSNRDKTTHGLGLKRIKSIAEAHGGSLTLAPEADCFTATLLVPLE